MCGRFAITLPADAMARIFAARPANDLPPTPNWNVAPTMRIHVVRRAPSGEGRELVGMRWGFLPSWYRSPDDGPLIINARAETVARKPAFARSIRERRCLVPASGFYEWQRRPGAPGQPWFIRPAAEEVLAMAGLWRRWTSPEGESLDTVAILTLPSSGCVRPLHDREPLAIRQQDWPLWLGERGKGAARLLQPPPEGWWSCWPVSTRVNSVRNNDPGLIEPIELSEPAPEAAPQGGRGPSRDGGSGAAPPEGSPGR